MSSIKVAPFSTTIRAKHQPTLIICNIFINARQLTFVLLFWKISLSGGTFSGAVIEEIRFLFFIDSLTYYNHYNENSPSEFEVGGGPHGCTIRSKNIILILAVDSF